MIIIIIIIIIITIIIIIMIISDTKIALIPYSSLALYYLGEHSRGWVSAATEKGSETITFQVVLLMF